MKNFKNIAFGLMVGALAIGFSAFTNIKKVAAGDQYGNTSNGQYTAITNYDPGNCQNVASQPTCGYEVTSAGATHVTGSFTASQAVTFQSNGWIQPLSSDKGLYIP